MFCFSFRCYAVFKDQRSAIARALQPNSKTHFIKGDDSGGDTPLPIPNREVKPASADGTAGETLWESRSSPIFYRFQAGPGVWDRFFL